MVKHLGTKQLETNRLILRKFSIDDAEDMFKNWANDEEVTKYLSWLPHGRIEVTKNILLSWADNYKKMEAYNWGIVAKDIGEVIGSISVVNSFCEGLVFEIGYCISKTYWNKGITTEALKTVIKFLIKEVKVERVHAIHNIDNVASGKVMLKAGMIFEGKLRKYHLNRDGVLEDVNMYSKIDTD
jgi:ribosomal-protein-alanine N-acetyltransferase